jgi:hypothetical protein
MISVEACVEVIIVIGHDAAGNCNGHSYDVDEDVNLALHHAPDCD